MTIGDARPARPAHPERPAGRPSQARSAGADNDDVVLVFLYFVGMTHDSGPQRQFQHVNDTQGHQRVGAAPGDEIQDGLGDGVMDVVFDHDLQSQHGVVQDHHQEQTEQGGVDRVRDEVTRSCVTAA